MTIQDLAKRLPPLPGHVLAGVSGGADSTALLLALTQASGVQVEAVHVNHGLRGEASDGDEAFVRALCAQQGVRLRTYRAVPPEHPGEGWAREARYVFFRQAMAESGAQALVLAHHRDDQAETLLLHLLRGAGLNGLAGMRTETLLDGMRVLRPLLDFSREELRAALTAAHQPWREDASNADPRYLRNAVRTQLLPLMEQMAPGAGQRIAATASMLRADSEAMAAQATHFLDRYAGGSWLSLAPLMALPAALQASVLRTWWQDQAGKAMDERSLDRMQTGALMQIISAQAGAKCNLPGRWQAQRGWKCLHLIPPTAAAPLTPVPAVDGAEIGGIVMRLFPPDGTPGDGAQCQLIPRGWETACVLRTRQPGDWLRPFGSGSRQSLQDYFVNRRVDAPFRDRVPLLCRGSEVLLAAGVGAGDIPPMQQINDGVRLVWQGRMPWANAQE